MGRTKIFLLILAFGLLIITQVNASNQELIKKTLKEVGFAILCGDPLTGFQENLQKEKNYNTQLLKLKEQGLAITVELPINLNNGCYFLTLESKKDHPAKNKKGDS